MTDRPDEQEQGPPRWVPYTPPPPDGWDRVRLYLRRLSFPVALLLFAVGVAGLFYWVEQQELRAPASTSVNVRTPESDRSGERAVLADGQARLTVRSVPDAAVVRLNGDSVGTTPLSDRILQPGAYMLSVQARGHFRADTVVVLDGDTEARLRFSLRPRPGDDESSPSTPAASAPTTDTAEQPPSRSAPVTAVPEAAEEAPDPPPAYGAVYVTSMPLGAVVSVAGTERGRSPVSVGPLAVGTIQVDVSMEGYEPWTEQVAIQSDSTRRVHADLSRRTGRLRVLARPWGTIYVNGTLHARESDVWYETEVPAGTHRVTAVHPTLGTQAQSVEVRVDEETSVEFDLVAQDTTETSSE